MTTDNERNLFLSLTAVLVGFGVLMVHSASITSRPTEFEQVYLSRHLVFLCLGVLSAAIAAVLPGTLWQRLAPWIFWGTALLLILVLVPGIGTKVKGAQRWFRFGPISVQPSELAKLALPLYLGVLMQWINQRPGRWLTSLVPLVPIGLAVGLVLVEPDLGTALFLGVGGGVALFTGGWPLRNFVLAGGLAVPAVASVVALKPYQMQRITGFLATWSDVSTAPYQLKQSLVTIAAGETWGVGLGRGYQKLSFLPEANTDFVFAVIGEELGLVGMLAILIVWFSLFVLGLRLVGRLPRRSFEATVAFTLLTQLVLQVSLNVAVVTAMVPPKGIAHPLLSYGGSNLVVSLVALGMIVGLTRESFQRTAAGDQLR